MSLTINAVHTFALSPGLESFIMATLQDVSEKIDELKASTDSKLGEFVAEVKALSDQVADLTTKITDPAELDAVVAKLDANKAAVDSTVVAPAPDAPSA